MKLFELEAKVTDAIHFHDELNPALWDGEEMRYDVRMALLRIAEDFREHLGIKDLAVEDLQVSGSNAAFTYTPYSDIDLHLIVDFKKLPNEEVYSELFNAKKSQYNDAHDIKVKGFDVELYVQDSNQPHASLGIYSVAHKDWIKLPVKERAHLDDDLTLEKYEKLKELLLLAIASKDLDQVDNVADVVRRYRKAGLDEFGEFGPENLAFKMLRNQGYLGRLYKRRLELEDQELSLEHVEEQSLEESFRQAMGLETMPAIKRITHDYHPMVAMLFKNDVQSVGHAMSVAERATDYANAKKIVKEDLVPIPIPQSSRWSSDWDARNHVEQIVWKIESKDLTPKVIHVDPRNLLATQEWLDPVEGGGDPVFDQYEDYPVVWKDEHGMHLLDGHHRTTSAVQHGLRSIPVYLFQESMVNEGVGIITKQNQTQDVGPNQIKIEAEKMGFTVDKGGIPANTYSPRRDLGLTVYERAVMEGGSDINDIPKKKTLEQKINQIIHDDLDDESLTEDPVWSSWISDLDHYKFQDGSEGVLMTTHNGREYFINGVDEQEYTQWMQAPSKGKHWWSDIKYFYT